MFEHETLFQAISSMALTAMLRLSGIPITSRSLALFDISY